MKQDLWSVYCRFSKKERQGIIILLVLTITCAAMPALWEYHTPPAIFLEQDSLFRADVRALRDVYLGNAVASRNMDSGRSKVERFHFDPNMLDTTGWMALGVSRQTAMTIQRYRMKGGRFRRKEDLLRIYGLPPALGKELLPYVSIPAGFKERDTTGLRQLKQRNISYVRRRFPALDINTADSAQWESLPGIGPVLAARIVRFREKLGGFYAIGQVGETFGLPDTTFNKIQPYLIMNKVSLKKLDINQTDEKSLAQHPYIRYKLARLIVLYRSNHGPFRRLEDLLGIPLVDDSIYRKIELYIKIENSPL
ncbi:ComEA family DNA-binding protein [Chitinophaga rhizophila]|uniref:Helix-hairpin-helix domain-containing protein n=1 Tax=Chitinophaga rhizophila TaxID=2866212 RepID=A0ABS7GH34_9BACT|nr:helix-hairpin-helix domain-containing protein [Chitinophaga rhizophila]MBW8686626.1 helix-hairpin-helix domain-containing protein [Chitinophaga rhizophila]